MEDTSEAFRFSAAAAGFGLLLQHYEPAWDFDHDDVRELARTAFGDDVFGHRGEFVELVKIADEIVR